MNTRGPVIIIEDDIDDQEMLTSVFDELGYDNEIIFFTDGDEALGYLMGTTAKPFLILSDINMPKLNGFALRDQIMENEKLRLKCIPFLFFTTAAAQNHVINAYSKSAQGFFTKPNSYGELLSIVRNIMAYWNDCVSPNYMK